jgi:phage tail-like protein
VANARTIDPAFAGKFKFEIGGIEIGSFTEVSGLSVQIDVEDLAEGGQNGYTHKLLGRMKWPNLVLKRGVTDSNALFEWLMQYSSNGFAKTSSIARTGKIEVLDPKGKTLRTWEFADAKPVRWSGPKLAASARELAVEELEVCHSGFRTS